ncbi:MAG: aldo/keto reductase [Acidobacteria bacterium]|nr:aldo/keto reductase [Acidobacteriota bacterium]
MKRRTVIGGLAGASLLPLASTSQSKVKAGDIPKRVFGKTGEKLTIIGLASGRFHLTNSEEDAIALVQHAYDLGINYFDTAHSYGNGRSEMIYGKAMKSFRKNIFLTTKSNKRSRKEAEAELDASLKSLQTDYLDLWQCHEVAKMEEVEKIFAPGGAYEAFEAAKKAGKCRFFGFTGHTDPEVHLALLKGSEKWETILMPLHIADPLYLSFEKQVLPIAVQRGMGIQGMKSLANSKLLQTFSVKECLTYTLSLPIHCLTLGCTTIGQLEDDVRIAQNFKPMEPSQLAALNQRATRIKGPLLEDWKKNIENKISMLERPEYVGG